MADEKLVPAADANPSQGGPVLDGLTAEKKVSTAPSLPSSDVSGKEVSRAKHFLLMVGGGIYTLYVLWCMFLLSVLPTSGPLRSLVGAGLLSAIVAAAVLLGVGFVAMQRIAKSDVSNATRTRSLIKTVAVVAPGLLLSAAVPLLISRAPPLWIDIVDPANAQDFVAPLAVTFSAESAVKELQQEGLKPIHFAWDFDADGKPNDDTVVPTSTGIFNKQGIYVVSVHIDLAGGSSRTISTRFTIPSAVFSVSPIKPIVERPVKFSVSDLLSAPESLKQIQWDFDGDGTVDETSTKPETVHTYYAVGQYAVTATLQLANQSQTTFKRQIDVEVAPPLPFPITLTSDPATLVGPAPFGASFRITTDEPLREIEWSYGDNKDERGANLKRVLHSWGVTGIYPVTVKARSASGSLAELSTLVRVTDTLQLSDLNFEGTPAMDNSDTIQGEAPLTLQLTPSTNTPLVQFSWEAPDASVFSATGAALHAIYRKEGNYKLTLVAQDPEGSAMRKVITVKVLPPAALPVIDIRPESGEAPLKITFDGSNSFVPQGEKIAGFEWTFGDEDQGTKPELGVARTEHLYVKPGEYQVQLRIVMASGADAKATRTIVIRRPALTACITASRLQLQVGQGVEFNSSCSTGIPTSYLWDVRSDTQPDVVLAQSPSAKYVYAFDSPGSYKVNLTIKDDWGNQDTKSLSITVTP